MPCPLGHQGKGLRAFCLFETHIQLQTKAGRAVKLVAGWERCRLRCVGFLHHPSIHFENLCEVTMDALERVATSAKVSSFVLEAVARMQTAPHFLSKEAWNDFASYEGPVVSGDPEGRLPDNLEDDGNE
mgnify:CR=1 FL=1